MATERMYDHAFSFKGTKLWKQLADSELFAVELPDGEIGYCSVMGMMGEHFALGVYPGQSGFASYCWTLESADLIDDLDSTEFFAAQDCLMCSFENKDMLTEEEVEEVRAYASQHEITLRGRKAFPQFMRYSPGMYPWHMVSELDEKRICAALDAAVWLKHVLKEHTKEEIGLREITGEDSEVMILYKENNEWKIGTTPLPSRNRVWAKPIFENEVLAARIRQMRKKGTWQVGTFYLPSPVMDEENPEDAPYFPLVLMSVDAKSGMVQPPIMDRADNPEELIRQFAEALLTAHACPGSIQAGDDRCFSLLKDLCGKTNIVLKRKNYLPELKEAKTSLLLHLDGEDEWESDEEDELEDANIDEFCETLMKMRDEELKTMPPDLADMLLNMADMNVIPDALIRRLRKLFKR